MDSFPSVFVLSASRVPLALTLQLSKHGKAPNHMYQCAQTDGLQSQIKQSEIVCEIVLYLVFEM